MLLISVNKVVYFIDLHFLSTNCTEAFTAEQRRFRFVKYLSGWHQNAQLTMERTGYQLTERENEEGMAVSVSRRFMCKSCQSGRSEDDSGQPCTLSVI